MQLPTFRRFLITLGYTMAAEKLSFPKNHDCRALAAAWLAWKADPLRAKSVFEIAGQALPTGIAPQGDSLR
jgi:hypothetical protein